MKERLGGGRKSHFGVLQPLRCKYQCLAIDNGGTHGSRDARGKRGRGGEAGKGELN